MRLNFMFILAILALDTAHAVLILLFPPAGEPSFLSAAASILLPFAINLLIYFSCSVCLKHLDFQEKLITCLPILVFFLLCTYTVFRHPDFQALHCLFFLPIFFTVIHTSKKMTRFVTLLALLFSLCSRLLVFMFTPPPSGTIHIVSLIPELISTCILLLFSYVLACLIIDDILKKNHMLDENMASHEKLAEAVQHDHLTGLYSLNAYEALLNDFTFEAWSNETPLCMAVIDIDNFKAVNDTYGHAQGNTVLVALADLLLSHCKNGEAVARYGGEEFVIFFPNTGLPTASVKLEAMRDAFSKLNFDFLPNGEHITFSSGLSPYPGNSYSPAFFFELADKALYHAKNNGKNRIWVEENK